MNMVRNLAALAIGTVLALVLLEVVVREFGLAEHLLTDPAYVKSDAPGVRYRYRSHFEGRVQGPTALSTNSFGARDREFSRVRPAGTLRIVVMGDSFAFGQGVRASESFPKLLERELAARLRGRSVEVINFGVQGYSLRQAVARYLTEGIEFAPQIAVLAPIADDLDPRRTQTFVDAHGYLTSSIGGEGVWKRWLRRFHSAYLVKGIVYGALAALTGGGSDVARDDPLPEERARELDAQVARFVEASAAADVVPVLALVDYVRTPVTDALAAHVRERFPTLQVIDMAPVFKADGAERFAVPRDGHPNAEAHRLIARLIAERLLTLPLLGQMSR